MPPRSGKPGPSAAAAPGVRKPLKGAKTSARGKKPISKSSLAFRGRSGGAKTATEMSSTDAQNNFGRLLDKVARDEPVFISRHNSRRAVMISVERYEALTRAQEPPVLDTLTAEFDAMLERMQSPQARRGAADLFTATPEELGAAAVAAARRAER